MQLNINNLFNFTLIVQFIDHEYMVISYNNALANRQLQSITSMIVRAAIAF